MIIKCKIRPSLTWNHASVITDVELIHAKGYFIDYPTKYNSDQIDYNADYSFYNENDDGNYSNFYVDDPHTAYLDTWYWEGDDDDIKETNLNKPGVGDEDRGYWNFDEYVFFDFDDTLDFETLKNFLIGKVF